ncbi:MAG: dihydrodipicolinate synthase family protein [Armatimonadetes bacterium]|nr:dihydrodipicolinate synthase family protein [Armatimonadota bacterium]
MTAEQLRQNLSGIFLPICTPFSEDEEVDIDALKFNLGCYAQTSIKGYLALGSNGENKSLTEAEKLVVLETIVKHKGEGKTVLAGATYEAQRDSELFFRQAADLGADYGLLLSPSYFRKEMTDDILYRYFTTVADSSPIPLLVYNAPGFSGIALSPELVGRLAGHPRIVGMKDSASSGIENFLRFASETFLVLAGSVNFLFPAMMNGSPGGTVSLGNSFPEITIELLECGKRRDQVRGAELQEKCSRVNKAISGKYGVAGVKAAMNLAGLEGGIPRRPLLSLTLREQDELRTVLVNEGLIQ